MKNVNHLYARIITTPIGNMIAIVDQDALISLDFTEESVENKNYDHPLLTQLEIELNQYFRRERKIFTLPLNPSGTLFQKKAWETLLTIPYGETLSYAAEAERFGKPKAVRAIANANGKNPISILIPCHRVIATDGGLGGYRGGLWRKEFLLDFEKKS